MYHARQVPNGVKVRLFWELFQYLGFFWPVISLSMATLKKVEI